MAREHIAERIGFAWVRMRAGGRDAWASANRSLFGSWRHRVSASDEIVVAPQDLRTADPTVASEIYSGRFAFAGRVVQTGGASPFAANPPSPDWQRELHRFAWLRHLRAAESAITRANARALIDDWIRSRRRQGVPMEPQVMARRLISWFSHANMILQDSDAVFYGRFLRSVTAQLRLLRGAQPGLPDGLVRLDVALALTIAALCLDRQPRLLASAVRDLSLELDRQVLPDGGHVSRHPGVAIDLLLDLLPLRQLSAHRLEAVPQSVIGAIDRLLPMLRFFRHADGALATFNGMGPTPADLLATITAYDETRGEPLSSARHVGYQRLAAAHSVVLFDVGRPPPISHSCHAHAGILAFEFSANRHRIVVSCGMPPDNADRWRAAARASAAHSVQVVNDTSTCRFASGQNYPLFGGVPIIGGPREVEVDRRDTDDRLVVRARHDAHAARYGLLMERRLDLTRDGAQLDGEDVLLPVRGNVFGRAVPERFALRFHLHPNVRAVPVPEDREIRLVLPNGETWSFITDAPGAALEDSVFLAASEGPRRTRQIVVDAALRDWPSVRWSFRRVG